VLHEMPVRNRSHHRNSIAKVVMRQLTDKIEIQLAGQDDLLGIFERRADETARLNSFVTASLSMSEHRVRLKV